MIMIKGKLGFGLMRFPLNDENDQKSIDEEQVIKMVDLFMSNGFNYFDTAYPYHEGLSETMFKKAVVDRYPRKDYLIADKMPTWLITGHDDFQKYFNEQIERCGIEYFDYYMMHTIGEDNYQATVDFGGFEFLKDLKKQGKAKHIGFSFHDNANILDKVLTEQKEMEFVLLQINYIDWENKSIESRKCYEVAKKHGVEVMVMEPVKGGALANVPKEVEKMFEDYDSDNSIASWAIRFAASLDNVSVVCSGMSNLEQMKDNLSFMKDFKPLNTEEKDLIAKSVDMINDSIAIPCTSCNYCLDTCPQNIPIPKYFSLFNDQKQFGYQANLSNYYLNLAKDYGSKASDCIECNNCIEHCPQHIDIVESLKDVASVYDNGDV